jgi:hypothetical protein
VGVVRRPLEFLPFRSPIEDLDDSAGEISELHLPLQDSFLHFSTFMGLNDINIYYKYI